MIRSFNLGNTLVILGLTALAITFYLPTWSAERVARVEGRAQATAQAFHDVALALAPIDPLDPEAVPRLRDGLRTRCVELGHPQSDLPELEPDRGERVIFGTKHYLFRIARRPDVSTVGSASPTEPPLDVYGWPRSTLPPGRTVFFFPADGPAAFSRNLAAGYAGLDDAPPANAGVPRVDPNRAADDDAYRSNDDERWLRLH